MVLVVKPLHDILSQLSDCQLQPQLLRGQAYDGAGAMAGKTKGVADRISAKYPKALFTHCAAHRLKPLCHEMLQHS